MKKWETSSLSTCSLREEKSFSQRAFYYTDIRKLQDKAKTSYTLSTRRLRLGYEQQFSKSTPGACFGVVGEEFIAYACNITFGSNKKWNPAEVPDSDGILTVRTPAASCRKITMSWAFCCRWRSLSITSCTISSRWTALCCAVARKWSIRQARTRCRCKKHNKTAAMRKTHSSGFGLSAENQVQ